MTTEHLSVSIISDPRKGGENSIDAVLKPEPHLLPWRPRIPPARLFSIGGKFHPAPHLLGEGKKRRGTELKMTPPLPLVRGHLHKNPGAIMWAELGRRRTTTIFLLPVIC